MEKYGITSYCFAMGLMGDIEVVADDGLRDYLHQRAREILAK